MRAARTPDSPILGRAFFGSGRAQARARAVRKYGQPECIRATRGIRATRQKSVSPKNIGRFEKFQTAEKKSE